MGHRRRSPWPLVSLRVAEPIVPEVEWNREAAGSVRTHTGLTIGKHTLAPNQHTQYPILFCYQAASVSWSSCRLTNATERSGRNVACAACSVKVLFVNAHLPQVSLTESQAHSSITPHSYNCKHVKDVKCVLDSFNSLQEQ